MKITGNILAIITMALSTSLTGFMFWRQLRHAEKMLQIEKNTKRDSEINNYKRVAYADFLTAFEEGLDAVLSGDEQRKLNAEIAINRSIAMVDLLCPKEIYSETSRVMHYAYLTEESELIRNAYIDNLITLMRNDLNVSNPRYDLTVIDND